MDEQEFIDCHTDSKTSESCHEEQANSEVVYLEAKPLIGGLLKGALKLAGSAALGAVGIAATVAREAGNLAGSELLTDLAGTVQDASFEKVRDMWGMDGTRKIDNMNLDELSAYIDRLEQDMDDEESESLLEMIGSIDSDGMSDAEYLVQVKEIVKEFVRDKGKFERATKRADSASRSAEQFSKRYEKEKEKLEKKYNKS